MSEIVSKLEQAIARFEAAENQSVEETDAAVDMRDLADELIGALCNTGAVACKTHRPGSDPHH